MAHEPDLLRFTTAGSVDDGKSTLIGRLLHDAGHVFRDQLEAAERASRSLGEEMLNLALLTDGLRAEREQKITIDVAYRYFATPRRRFIIADTPGHVQHTRNMVTGASTAELAVILVDATRGVTTQSRRHAFIASLLGISHLVVAVNKMDLVEWREEAFLGIVDDFRRFSEKLEVADLSFFPVSALGGDNVVTPSRNMPWHLGGTLLHHLETVNVAGSRNLVDFRMPVQLVVRPEDGSRGYAGRIASGRLRPGDEVAVLPSGARTRVRSIESFSGRLPSAGAGDSVVVTTEDEVDVARGDLLVRPMNLPTAADRLEAIVCWLDEAPLEPGREYVLLHTTREVRAVVTRLVYRIGMEALHRQPAEQLGLNDIGRVRIETARPLYFDPYRANRETGAFVLVDPASHATVAAGMIRSEVREVAEVAARPRSPDVTWEPWNVPRQEREARAGQRAAVVWFTGVSGAGKSTLARGLERRLWEDGRSTVLLDGDQLRHGLSGDLGFSREDRRENLRRAGEVARLFFEHGQIVLCAFVSPYREDRDRIRALFPEGRFVEVHVRVEPEEARRRDPKGLYARQAAGEIQGLTGADAPYEESPGAEVVVDTTDLDPGGSVERLLEALRGRGILD